MYGPWPMTLVIVRSCASNLYAVALWCRFGVVSVSFRCRFGLLVLLAEDIAVCWLS